nr:MAG TPA: hypothetical protein [Bacteriophage sp.]DAM35235.1 MAG TPA: hypothetical protein [Bacteriophage sp.]
MVIINTSHIISIKSESHSNRYYISIFTTSESFNKYYKTKEECELILREIKEQIRAGYQFIYIDD